MPRRFANYRNSMIQATQHTLPNGLTVLLKEVHSAPVISWWLAYRVGSRNEPTGKTGISHWVEHMMFKGTPRFPAGMLDREIDRAGGQWNAFTSMDATKYFETLPADKIDIAMQAEADRMSNALFDREETESERTVIISERQGAENQPTFWLQEELRAAAFRVHGYHHEIIGDETDLRAMTRDDLYAHYRAHYQPANAAAIAVGAFDSRDMLAKIEKLYGDIPAQPAPELFARPEPPQQGQRRIAIERPGKTAFCEISHRAPAATHPDWMKLKLLDAVLSGSSGASDNKTSRLYAALVKSEIAASVSASLTPTVDPYLYSILITLRDGRSPEEAEAALLGEIECLQKKGISENELNKARKQSRAAFAYSTESVTWQAYWLAQSFILGEVGWFDAYAERLMSVSADDVLDVARRYLVPNQRVVGYLHPTDAQGASA
ncbi:MAG: insulinase family protein [Chloroflexi bacterium]|nr:insulinase family protein [Chloroflexota bacterium]